MPETKPTDFLSVVFQFFAILLPGAALVYLVQPWTAPLVPLGLRPQDSTSRGIVFAVLAYVVGHMLHAFAGLFDKLYDKLYLRHHAPDHYNATNLFKQAKKEKNLAILENLDSELASTLFVRSLAHAGVDSIAGTSLYDWCFSYVRTQNSPAAAEVDRLQTDSKVFRSFAIVMLVAGIVTLIGGSPVLVAVSFLSFLFSVWRYCVLRWDATKRVYEFYLLLHKFPPPRSAA